jgi:hypothetical protein
MNATHAGRWQFSVRSLLLMLACCSLLFAVLPVLGVVAGSMGLILLAQFLAVRWLPGRWQIYSVVICLLFASLPHLGVSGYYFGSIGGDWEPPQLNLGEPPELLLPLLMCFNLIYAVAEFPVHLLGECVRPWGSYVFFAGEGVVTTRPFAVWMFWLQMAATGVLAIVASQIEKRRSRSRNRLGLAQQANMLHGEHGSLNHVALAADPLE